ncbi:hypothetical protein E2C01_101412 [Portunus trituberculatus]|uniref:Uncharacterized protein n=1 Tax=Portunus trituberculatus TaxID=210409 RepID=A0A5B7KFI3_PORTR|nr:hypothetical protein [Portunus trituberculatus]
MPPSPHPPDPTPSPIPQPPTVHALTACPKDSLKYQHASLSLSPHNTLPNLPSPKTPTVMPPQHCIPSTTTSPKDSSPVLPPPSPVLPPPSPLSRG